MALPHEKITASANLWLRQMVFEKIGDQNIGHQHNYDHITLLAKGSVRVYVDEKTTDFKAPQMIFIKKGKRHYLEALEDDTIAYCVHVLREVDTGEILSPDQIPVGAFDETLPYLNGIAKPL